MFALPVNKSSPKLGFAGILFASLIAALDAVALSVSLPSISASLNLTTSSSYWSATIFVLASAAFQPLFPSFSAVFGRRSITLVALLFFIIGTLLCALSQNGVDLLIGRALQGIGSGGTLAMMYVVMADLWDLKHRAKAMSINGLVWLVGLSVGPIVGGALCMYAGADGWRWIFWLCLPLAVISFALVSVYLYIPDQAELKAPSSSSSTASFDIEREYQARCRHRATPSTPSLGWNHVDYLGAFLLVTGLTSFLVPLTWGGIEYSWTAWNTLLPLILGICGLIAWTLWELLRTAGGKTALIPLRIVTGTRTAAISFFGILVSGITQYGMIFYLPLYYQIVKGYTPIISGVALLPQTCLTGPITFATGIIIQKTGRYKIITLAGWFFLCVGCALLVLLGESTTVPQWIMINVVSGIGMGILFTSINIASQAEAREEDTAIAAGLGPFLRAIGQSIGISACNALLSNSFKHNLLLSTSTLLRDNADFITKNLASPQAFDGTGYSSYDKEAFLQAFAAALRNVWWLLFALATLAGILTLLCKDVNLDREHGVVELDNIAQLDVQAKSQQKNARIITMQVTSEHQGYTVVENERS